jgi:hypothetical protein
VYPVLICGVVEECVLEGEKGQKAE